MRISCATVEIASWLMEATAAPEPQGLDAQPDSFEKRIMSSFAISAIVFTCVFGGALLGMFLRRALPEHHLSTESKSTVNVGIALISTMTALVLGLLVASAASSYNAQKDELTQVAAKFALLDRLLAHYGPETKETRDILRSKVAGLLNQLWPQEHSRGSQLAPTATGAEVLYENIQQLSPQNDGQRFIKSEALSVALDIGKTRWLMYEQESVPIPTTFLVVVVFWLTVVFTSYGLYAPRNPTVMVTLFLCALSVAGAILLVLELYKPFEGLIQISSAPLRNALAQMGK
jgi:Protein of unknown function (DUF4239)